MRLTLKLLLFGVAFVLAACSVGASEQCFDQVGSDIKFNSDGCTKGKVKFELNKQNFLVEFSAPGFQDTGIKRYELTVGECNLEGLLQRDDKSKLVIGFEKGGVIPANYGTSPSATLTAIPDKLSITFESGASSFSIPCTVGFEPKDDGKYFSSLSIDLIGSEIKGLVVVIKDATMQGLENDADNAGLLWWVSVLIGAVVVLAIVAIGFIGGCLYRYSKKSKAKAREDIEAQAKEAQMKDGKTDESKPDASKPDERKPDESKPEKEAKKSTGSDEKKPEAQDKVDAEASHTKVKKEKETGFVDSEKLHTVPKRKPVESKPKVKEPKQSHHKEEAKPKLKEESQLVKFDQKDGTSSKVGADERIDHTQRADLAEDPTFPDFKEPKPIPRKKKSKKGKKHSKRKKISRRRLLKKSSEDSVAPASLPEMFEPEKHRFMNLDVLAATSRDEIRREVETNPLTEAFKAGFAQLYDVQFCLMEETRVNNRTPPDTATRAKQTELLQKLQFLSGQRDNPAKFV